jgi:hypothetical protein
MSKLIPLVKPALNLAERHFQSTLNGIIVIGTWLRDGRKFQPCLVLLHPMRPVAAGRTIPIVIPLSEAWRWAVHGEVGDPLHCVLTMNEWFRDGLLDGQIGNRKDHMRVLDAVNQRLPDLIAMPPRPKGEQAVAADVTLINKQTGEIIQRELKEDV